MAIHRSGGANLMVSLCRDLDQCRRRHLQIEHQCGHALSLCLVDRLRAEQRALAVRVSELQRSVAALKRHTSVDPLSVAFLAEVARRSWGAMRCSLG